MFLFEVVKYELEQFTSLLGIHNINSLMSPLMPLQSFIVYSSMYLYTATRMLLQDHVLLINTHLFQQ